MINSVSNIQNYDKVQEIYTHFSIEFRPWVPFNIIIIQKTYRLDNNNQQNTVFQLSVIGFYDMMCRIKPTRNTHSVLYIIYWSKIVISGHQSLKGLYCGTFKLAKRRSPDITKPSPEKIKDITAFRRVNLSIQMTSYWSRYYLY